MNTKVILIVGAVIVALYFVFSRNQTPSGIGTQYRLGLPAIPPQNSQAGLIASGIGSLTSSIARALGGGGSGGGGNPLGATITPAAAASTGASDSSLAVGSYYSQAIGNETLEEPTYANNSNSFTIVGTGPAPIAAPNVTPSNTPTPGVLAFLNPNGNVPPPILADGGTGNYSLDNASLLASGPSTNYGSSGVSLEGDSSGIFDFLGAAAAAPAPVG